MRRRLLPVLALLAGCGPLPTPLVLPLPTDASATWAGIGVGLGSTGVLAQGDLNRYQGGRLYRARLSGHDNSIPSTAQDAEPKSLTEWSLLVGRGTPCCGSNWGGWALGGGIVNGSRGGPARDYTTFGAAGEVFLVSGRWPHVSISAAANLNPEDPVAWFTASLLLGRMPFIGVPGVPPRLPR